MGEGWLGCLHMPSHMARYTPQVGGDLVLKINDYTLEEGERSVFDSELEGRQDRPGKSRNSERRAARNPRPRQ